MLLSISTCASFVRHENPNYLDKFKFLNAQFLNVQTLQRTLQGHFRSHKQSQREVRQKYSYPPLSQSRTQSNAFAQARMALALGKLNFCCAVIGLTFINRACRQRTGTPKFRGSGCQFPQSQCHPSPRTGIALGTRLPLSPNLLKTPTTQFTFVLRSTQTGRDSATRREFSVFINE